MVVMSTQRRLAALEGSGDECPHCGDPGDDGGEQTYEVVFMEEGDPEPGPDEYCPECGRPIHITISFEDGS
jgi:hypothetical protein